MKLKIEEAMLPCGLKILHTRVPSDDVSVLFSVNAGPLAESTQEAGISHIIEHMLFKGTKKRTSRDAIYNEINLLGGQQVCHTNHTNVPLGFRVIKEDFTHALELASDLLFNSLMNNDELKKEKGVVLDEMKSREQNPYNYGWGMLNSLMFKETILDKPVIGTIESVTGFKQEQVNKFYKRIFTPSNSVLVTVGDLSLSTVVSEVNKLLGTTKLPVPPKIKIKLPAVGIEQKFKKAGDTIHLFLGQAGEIHGLQQSINLELATAVVSRNVFDRLVNIEGISYNAWATFFTIKEFGVFSFYATTQKQHWKRVQKILTEEFEKTVTNDLSTQRIIDVAKSRQKSFVLGGATTMEKAKHILECYLRDDVEAVNKRPELYRTASPKEVQKAIHSFVDKKKLNIAIVGNY